MIHLHLLRRNRLLLARTDADPVRLRVLRRQVRRERSRACRIESTESEADPVRRGEGRVGVGRGLVRGTGRGVGEGARGAVGREANARLLLGLLGDVERDGGTLDGEALGRAVLLVTNAVRRLLLLLALLRRLALLLLLGQLLSLLLRELLLLLSQLLYRRKRMRNRARERRERRT